MSKICSPPSLYKVVEDYVAVGSKEISLTKDTFVTVESFDTKGWACGTNENGEKGIFPTTAVIAFTSEPVALRTRTSKISKKERLSRRVSSKIRSVMKGVNSTASIFLKSNIKY